MESDNLIVSCACDSGYLDYAISLIRSLDVFSPGYQFVLHLVNSGSDDIARVEDLGRRLLSTRLAATVEEVDFKFPSEDLRRTYYACARFMMLPDLIAATSLPILCLDADSLFVNPIDCRFSEQGEADVVLFSEHLRDEVAPKRKIKNGAIVVRPSAEVRNLLEDVRNMLAERFAQGTGAWYLDQEVFSHALNSRHRQIKVGHIRKEYLDWEFHGSSIVWTAKGDRKEDARFQFMKEMLSDRRPEELSSLAEGGVLPLRSPWSRPRVAIFQPRFDLPWKAINENSVIPVSKEDVVDLRLRWKHFAILLANTLERKGIRVAVHEIPAGEIQPGLIDRIGCELAFIPHRCHLDFEVGNRKILFYMQEYFRWVFVVNHQGWSASSSAYPIDQSVFADARKGAFDDYRSKLQTGLLQSKFGQPASLSYRRLRSSGDLPGGDYVFFPLQIPHDQSIRYFSDFEEADVVDAVLAWANRSGVPIVFKPHPVSQKLMKPFSEKVKAQGGYWSTANVHDLIAGARAVFTINSGVGFEALLHVKPVVTFGRAEYDAVSIHATPEDIDIAWSACQAASGQRQALELRYRSFVDWFLGDYAIDLSNQEVAMERLEAIAQAVAVELGA
jgi:hypothetical protein